jgi:hypothetical protein
MSKKISPFDLQDVEYNKFLKILAHYSKDRQKIVSVREAVVELINEKYAEITGSMEW